MVCGLLYGILALVSYVGCCMVCEFVYVTLAVVCY